MKFVDLARISIRAGDGGVGCVSFRREKFVPRGGPDGGNGGRGGDIVIRANRHLATLLDYQYRRTYRAPRGAHGLGARKTGPSGKSIILEVPVGTLVREIRNGEVIADLLRDGDEIVAARGGRGGRGNAEFATASNQAPRKFEHGEEGEEREIELELKLLADAGLVGLPNAGKSTLISVISAARPKIADYPFTTLVPNLGIVSIGEGRSFVVADIPGLIEGSHSGKGLGLQFLRHVERTRVLVFLLDGTQDDLRKAYNTLQRELRLFDPHLLRKPQLVAITKIDSIPDARAARLRRMRFHSARPHLISSVTGAGIKELVRSMWTLISRFRPTPA
jgi:GTP-binding protein